MLFCGDTVKNLKYYDKQLHTWALEHSTLYKNKLPFFLFNGHGNINFDAVPVHLVQNRTIEFYFFEPLSYYSEIKPGYQDHNLRLDNPAYLKSLEIDSVVDFANKHNINIKYYLPDVNVNFDYEIDLEYFDPYLQAEIFRLNTFNKYFPFVYYTHKIKKKLWCGTWRYDPVRQYIMSELVDKQVHIDNNFSWFYTIPKTQLKNVMWFDLVDTTKLENLNKVTPLNIDTDFSSIDYQNTYPPTDYTDSNPVNSYYECFCALVIESQVAQPMINVSEKTLHAIKNMRPFLLYAAPGTLELLRKNGIKTFGDYWDESYDNIENTVERIHAVNHIATELNNKPLDELISMYKDMKHILYHNISAIKKYAYKT